MNRQSRHGAVHGTSCPAKRLFEAEERRCAGTDCGIILRFEQWWMICKEDGRDVFYCKDCSYCKGSSY